jgi:phosphate transport system protein
MGRLATEAAQRVTHTLTAPTGNCLPQQEREDDAIDQLHRVVLDQVRLADPPYPTRVGVGAALLARYVERFADQAVSVTKQLDYMVTGQKTT